MPEVVSIIGIANWLREGENDRFRKSTNWFEYFSLVFFFSVVLKNFAYSSLEKWDLKKLQKL
jgi:hypothetical protein